MVNVSPKLHNEHPISASKCWLHEDLTLDNGRVVFASKLGITVTEQDFITYMSFYNVEKFSVTRLTIYEKQYLPHPFVKSVLELFQRKTRLDGIPEEYVNYMIAKNMANSTFGMSVTDPVRDELEYIDNEYRKERANLVDSIKRYNENKRRFLFYPWGVWITAYARRNLFTGIESVGSDFIYADTDSIKMLNRVSHESYFNHYNMTIDAKIAAAAAYHRISEEEFKPVSPKGVQKVLGIWDYEGDYDDFKTLGAKRYLYSAGGNLHLTLAGANKQKARDYLNDSGDPFANFDDGLVIPSNSSGRLTLTYIDDELEGTLVDCNGVPYYYHEKSSIHMEKSEYSLTMSNDFINFLKGVQELE